MVEARVLRVNMDWWLFGWCDKNPPRKHATYFLADGREKAYP
jgi:hypothetical protein